MLAELKIIFSALKKCSKNIWFILPFLLCILLAAVAEGIPLLVPFFFGRLQELGGQSVDASLNLCAVVIILTYGPLKTLSYLCKNLVSIIIAAPLATCFSVASESYVAKLLFANIANLRNLSSSQISSSLLLAQESFSGVVFISIFLLLPKIIAIFLTFAMAVKFLKSIYLALLLCFVLFYILILKKNVQKVEGYKKQFRKKQSAFAEAAAELWKAREFILLNDQGAAEFSSFQRKATRRCHAEAHLFERLGYFELQQTFLICATLFSAALLSLFAYRQGEITFVGILAILSTTRQFTLLFKECSSMVRNLLKYLTYLQLWAHLEKANLNCQNEIVDGIDEGVVIASADVPTTINLHSLQPSLCAKNIILHKGTKAIFTDLSAFFVANGIHLVCGPNGSGKSSLLRVLLGLEAVSSGSVLLSGHDIKSLTWQEKHSLFGYTEQQPRLFAATIRENIFYGIATRAVKKSLLNDVIDFLGDELWTRPRFWVGVGGQNLAKGAITKIRIAQAILKNPKILLLDEPTNNLDSVAQEKLLHILTKLAQHTLIIVATHHAQLFKNKDSQLDLVAAAAPTPPTSANQAADEVRP